MVHDDVELEAARPNEAMRRAALDLLDVADRAGVQLSGLSLNYSGGKVHSANMHGVHEGWRMRYTDGLRILLRLQSRAGLNGMDDVRDNGRNPYLAVHTEHRGIDVTVFCDPSPAQLEELAQVKAQQAAAVAEVLAERAGVRS